MRALVSTMQHLLHVDLDTREVVVLQSDQPEYYGITWAPGSDGLVLSHSGVDNATLLSLEAYATSERGWLSFPGGRTQTFLSAPHQIHWCSDGRVVCTNTGRNRLVAVDPLRPGHFQEAGLSPSRWDRLGPGGPHGDHLNSVFERDGKLYAIAHGHSHGSRLAIFSYPDMTLLSADAIPGRTGLHNIFVPGDGQQLSCHSEASALVDLSTQTILWEAGTPIYTRGMAASDDHIFLGESAKTGRDLRRSSMSGLWMIDRRTWRTSDYFALGPYGAVHEVRLIDVPDHAHHGTPLHSPQALRATTAHDRLRTHKIEQSHAAMELLRQWSDFELSLNSSEPGKDGWRDGGEGLSIATRKPGASSTWEFDYRLNEGGHVSVIVDYDGRSGDTGMTAFLMQQSGATAQLQEWQEAGHGWVAGKVIGRGLPTHGRVSVTLAETRFGLAINGDTVHTSSLPASALHRFSGIRWLNAGIRPALKD